MRLFVNINPDQKETLQRQIVEQVIALIGRGVLPPGIEVPSSRSLSEQLCVSRNTVKEAYEELVDQGYLYTQRAVGTFVSNELPETFIACQFPESSRRNHASPAAPLPYAEGETGRNSNAPRCLTDFGVGRGDRRVFPEKLWRRLANECMGSVAAAMSDYANPCGSSHLRSLIADNLRLSRGMAVTPEQVFIVSGCQQGISLAAHLLIQAGSHVAVEAPCYRGAAELFESRGAKVVPAPVDGHGIQTSRLPRTATKLVYVTPSHQSPTGVTLSLERRNELLAWAAKVGSFVLEVEYDSDFRYDGPPPAPLFALDGGEIVIHAGSFANSVGPGLRLGYLVLPRSLTSAARKIKSLMDNGSSWLEQATLAAFIEGGHFAQHVRRLRQVALARRDALLGALHESFGAAEIFGRESGTHVMWKAPRRLPEAKEISAIGRRAGVRVHSLAESDASYCDCLPGADRAVVFGFASMTEQEIEGGIEKLAAAIRNEARPAGSRPQFYGAHFRPHAVHQ